jgi:glycerol uptake facilitator-like aquaporin
MSNSVFDLRQKLAAEFTGTGFLVGTVVGSGIMAERLSDGNVGLALLANGVATGAILVVLIIMFAPISGAHLNPAVSLVMRLNGTLGTSEFFAYIASQIVGGLVGVMVAHAMFAETLFQFSGTERNGAPQWLAEVVATFGLVLTILLTLRSRPGAVGPCVGLYIASAYWFTASTSFANPAVTIARALTNTFSGIRPLDVGPFLLAEIIGAVLALYVARLLLARSTPSSEESGS